MSASVTRRPLLIIDTWLFGGVGDQFRQLRMQHGLAAVHADVKRAQTMERIDALLQLGQRQRRRGSVVLRAVAAAQVAAPRDDELRVDGPAQDERRRTTPRARPVAQRRPVGAGEAAMRQRMRPTPSEHVVARRLRPRGAAARTDHCAARHWSMAPVAGGRESSSSRCSIGDAADGEALEADRRRGRCAGAARRRG